MQTTARSYSRPPPAPEQRRLWQYNIVVPDTKELLCRENPPFSQEENSLEASPLFASFSPVKPSPSRKGLLFYEDRRRQRADEGATKCRSLEDSNDDVYSIRRTINAGARSGGGGGEKSLFGLSDKPEKRIHQTMAVMEEQQRGEKVVIFSPPLSLSAASFLPSCSIGIGSPLFLRIMRKGRGGGWRRTGRKSIAGSFLLPISLPPRAAGANSGFLYTVPTPRLGKKISRSCFCGISWSLFSGLIEKGLRLARLTTFFALSYRNI